MHVDGNWFTSQQVVIPLAIWGEKDDKKFVFHLQICLGERPNFRESGHGIFFHPPFYWTMARPKMGITLQQTLICISIFKPNIHDKPKLKKPKLPYIPLK